VPIPSRSELIAVRQLDIFPETKLSNGQGHNA